MSTEKNMLTKEDILGAKDLETKKAKAWGGLVTLRAWTGKDRDRFETTVQRQSTGAGKNVKLDTTRIRVLALSMSLVDANGNLMFTKDDLEALNAKSSKAINDLFDVVQEMNGLGDEEIEELRKNS